MTDEKLQFMYVMHPTDPAKVISREGWTDYDRETFDLHMVHLNSALDSGKLIIAGRTLDADGSGPAIVVFEAKSAVEAQRIFAAEPFIKRGFATGTLRPHRIAISRNEL